MAGMTSQQSLTSQIQGFSEVPSVFYIPGIKMRTDNKRGKGRLRRPYRDRSGKEEKDALAGYLGNRGRTACYWLALEQNFKRQRAPGNNRVCMSGGFRGTSSFVVFLD